jgi:uncharacterized cupin superfamily protein
MSIVNLHADEWGKSEDRPGWQSKRANIGRSVGGELIGASLYELGPGDKLWPYHTHHANEEWLLVVKGEPTLRTPDGEQQLREGDVACFKRGPAGAHQVLNGSDGPIRVLMLSTQLMPEIVEYLDTGKVGVRSATGERVMLSKPGPTLDYWEGED